MKWIKVEDRLPEKNDAYLCCSEYGFISIFKFATDLQKIDSGDFEDIQYKCKSGWYQYDSEWGYCEIEGISHWMPLPEPPLVDEYIMPTNASHRKQRGRTAPNKGES